MADEAHLPIFSIYTTNHFKLAFYFITEYATYISFAYNIQF